MNLQEIDITLIEKFDIIGMFDARVVKCYDGDSPTFAIKINNNVRSISCRLHGIDTPEMRGDKQNAVKSRNRLIQLITDQEVELEKEYSNDDLMSFYKNNKKIVRIECLDISEKYGRKLCHIFVDNENVKDILIKENLGVEYDGGKKN